MPLYFAPQLANPTALLGLAAINGSALTAMRSDGAPALSQAIAPTWTGIHVFNNHVDLASTTESSPIVVRKGGLTWMHTFTADNNEAGPDQNIFIGIGAGNLVYGGGDETQQTGNVGIGTDALGNLTTGARNIALGILSLESLTAGDSNTAVGYSALVGVTVGVANTAFGNNAGKNITTGSDNIALGTLSLSTFTGSGNTAIGAGALGQVGSNNIGIGFFAGAHAVGDGCVIIDNFDRGTATRELREAMLYGISNASVASQTVRINAAVTISESINLVCDDGSVVTHGDDAVLYADA